MVSIARDHQQVDVIGDSSYDFALDSSSKLDQLHALAAEPSGGGGKQQRPGLSRNLLKLGGGFAPAPGPAQQADPSRLGDITDIGGRHVQEGDAAAGGKVLGGHVKASLPGSLNHPDDGPHGRHHPTNRKETQSASVAATSTAGTLMAPRRVNSIMGSSSPRWRSTRRQSRVASEPT